MDVESLDFPPSGVSPLEDSPVLESELDDSPLELLGSDLPALDFESLPVPFCSEPDFDPPSDLSWFGFCFLSSLDFEPESGFDFPPLDLSESDFSDLPDFDGSGLEESDFDFPSPSLESLSFSFGGVSGSSVFPLSSEDSDSLGPSGFVPSLGVSLGASSGSFESGSPESSEGFSVSGSSLRGFGGSTGPVIVTL